MADAASFGDLDENDPASVARLMKRMGREMGEDLGDDFEEAVDEAMEESEHADPADESQAATDSVSTDDA
jgi:hypothetical protein